MNEKLFVNIGNEIYLNGKWGCSANGEHCVDVITPVLNELIDENERLKTELQNTSDQRDEFHRGVRENANRVGKLEKEIGSLVCENQQLKLWQDNVFKLIKARIKVYQHKPVSAPVSNPFSNTYDAEHDRLSRLSELESLLRGVLLLKNKN